MGRVDKSYEWGLGHWVFFTIPIREIWEVGRYVERDEMTLVQFVMEDDTPIWVNPDKVMSVYIRNDRCCTLIMERRECYHVQGTPDEVASCLLGDSRSKVIE